MRYRTRKGKPQYKSVQSPMPLDGIIHQPTDDRTWAQRRAAIKASGLCVSRRDANTLSYGLDADVRPRGSRVS